MHIALCYYFKYSKNEDFIYYLKILFLNKLVYLFMMLYFYLNILKKK